MSPTKTKRRANTRRWTQWTSQVRIPRYVRVLPRRVPGHFKALISIHAPKAIRNEREYKRVLSVVDELLSVPKMTKGQEQYLDTLSVLVEAYERENHKINTSDISPIETLEFLMEQHGMSKPDLGKLLGNRSVAYKVISGERGLSKTHIQKLCRHFGVGPELFLDVGG